MNPDGPVLVIGASGIDVKGRPKDALLMGMSNAGVVRSSVGGVARNVAENLARLEVPTILLSAVGEDPSGDFLLEHARAAGVDTSHVLRVPAMSTGSYAAIFDATGQLVVAVSEYDIISQITPSYVQRHRALFAEAALVALDANLSPRTLESVCRWAERYVVPICADPTSPVLATKLIAHLPALMMVAPDASEAAVLCDADPPATSEAAIATAQCLVSMGVDIAVVTMAELGLAYADGSSAGHVAALRTQVVDTTGSGDAVTAAIIFGLLHDMPIDEAVRLGVSAAALTLRTRHSVVPDLSLDRLYDELII